MKAGDKQQETIRAFLCHSSKDSKFVIEVAKHLKRNLDEIFYYEEHQQSNAQFTKTINEKLEQCNVMVTFVGEHFTAWQDEEANRAIHLRVRDEKKHKQRQLFTVLLPGVEDVPSSVGILEGYPKIRVDGNRSMIEEAYRVAKEIVRELRRPWRSVDDLPLDPHLFSYEKDVIKYFITKARLEAEIQRTESMLESQEEETDEFKQLQDNRNQLWTEYEEIQHKQLDGCPEKWPEVTHWQEDQKDNQIPEDEIGKWRPDDAKVVAAALSTYHNPGVENLETPGVCMIRQNLCFPEAGPRQKLFYPIGGDLRVAVLVSGGIAPGINAVIDGINQRHHMYSDWGDHPASVLGLRNGFRAFWDWASSYCMLATRQFEYPGLPELVTTEHAGYGGSILGTSRVNDLLEIESRGKALERIVSLLLNSNIDILYVIGGDGSMKAAHAIWSYAREYAEESELKRRLSVVAIPKTMDNDILWVWQTFGFLSAVEKAREVIETLATEAQSNPRLGVIQLFGSDSGFVVSHAVLASRTGICDAALIPEIRFSMKGLTSYLKEKLGNRMSRRRESIPHGLLVMAETAIPTDAMEYLDDPDIDLSEDEKQAIRDFEYLRESGKRIEGQTNDFLRNAGLKIASRGLHKMLGWDNMRVFTNEPRHLLRAISPTTSDLIFGHRLGTLAVDNAMAGYTDFMISQWLTEYILVPLKLVVLGRKRIPAPGIFWKSVLARTGQPANLE